LKCGINTGEVIVADLGIEKLEYIGPVVNSASRFAGLAKLQTVDSNSENLCQALNENLLKNYTTLRFLGMSSTVICF
jgi:class 3 adenylate cyclase